MTSSEIIDKYIGLPYDFSSFNCWHLVDSVRADLGYQSHKFSAITPAIRDVSKAFEFEIERGGHGLHQQQEMRDHDVVIMSRRWGSLNRYHCGVVIDGKVLHADNVGVAHVELSELAHTWQRIEFWR